MSGIRKTVGIKRAGFVGFAGFGLDICPVCCAGVVSTAENSCDNCYMEEMKREFVKLLRGAMSECENCGWNQDRLMYSDMFSAYLCRDCTYSILSQTNSRSTRLKMEIKFMLRDNNGKV